MRERWKHSIAEGHAPGHGARSARCGVLILCLIISSVPGCGFVGGGGGGDCCPGSYLSTWDLDSGELEQSFELIPPVTRFAFSLDRTRFATMQERWGSGSAGLLVRIRSAPGGELQEEIALDTNIGTGSQPLFSPDLRWMALFPYVRGGRASRFLLWDLEAAAVHAEFPGLTPIGFSADGRQLLTYGYADPPSQERRVTWWDVETQAEIAWFTVDGLPLKLHAATGRLVVGFVEPGADSSRKTVSISLVDTRADGASTPLGTLEYDGWSLEDTGLMLVFSDDGSTLALGEVFTVRVWRMDGDISSPAAIDLARPEAWASFSPPSWVTLSPDGDRLLVQFSGFDREVGCSVQRVQLWDLGTAPTPQAGQPPRALDSPLMEGARLAVFLPDGTLMTLGRPCFAVCDFGHRIC